MKRAIAAVVTATALTVPAAVIIAAPAQAAEPYVTQAEFRQVTKGMRLKRVHLIFDISGKQTMYFPAYPSLGMPAEQTREYRVKSEWGSVDVDYKRKDGVWVVIRKTAYWG